MEGQTSKGLRITILFYAIYFVVFGLLHVISPELMGARDPATERLFGAALVAFALGAGLAWLERAWDRVRIVVLLQVIWMVLYTISMAWGILAGAITADAWIPTIIGAIFAVVLPVLVIREGRIKS
jgi:hypothetical protein